MSSPTKSDSLSDRLSRYREITISVTGRKSGHISSRPVWFVFEDNTVFLVPVQGIDTQWYKNVLANPKISIDARGEKLDLKAVPIKDHKNVAGIVDKFREKYGAADIKKYYSKLDAAVRVPLH
jgi:deazaflavin-dependent oxidoreductase (nitroreductase family)